MIDQRKTINRKQAAELLGIGINKLLHIIQSHKRLGFPAQMNTGFMNQQYYEDEVLAFKETADYHNIKWVQPKKPSDIKKVSFDNDLAIAFLSKPASSENELSFSQLVNKHCRTFGKTTTVHLQERNDIERPHSGFAQFSYGVTGSWVCA